MIFLGSFNMDPRSIMYNTEMSILVESPELAGRVVDYLFEAFPTKAYRLELTDGAAAKPRLE